MVRVGAQIRPLVSSLLILLCTVLCMKICTMLAGISMRSGMLGNTRKPTPSLPTKSIEPPLKNSISQPTSPRDIPNPINHFIRCDDDKEISIIHLVMMWPPSNCITPGTCWPDIEMTRFYIHGLWPADENGRHLLGCSLRFSPSDIPQLMQNFDPEMTRRLNEHWPSYLRDRKYLTRFDASLDFWKHEYLKHGTCTDLSFEEYFRRGVDIGKNLKIENWISATGIFENSAQRGYNKEQLLTILYPYNEGKKLYLSCKGSDHRLVEIIICLDVHAHGVISCPLITNDFGCKGLEVTFYKSRNF